MGKPKSILDPAAGMCEFINAIPANNKYAVDMSETVKDWSDKSVETIIGDIFEVDLGERKFDGVFMSNFLEHLGSVENVTKLFFKLKKHLNPDGTICIMGPNFKYCYKDYFDCSDHNLILTHMSVEEILYACGYDIVKSYPKFLPFSFRGKLPPSKLGVSIYLKCKFLWPILGKQFLITAKPAS